MLPVLSLSTMAIRASASGANWEGFVKVEAALRSLMVAVPSRNAAPREVIRFLSRGHPDGARVIVEDYNEGVIGEGPAAIRHVAGVGVEMKQ